MTDAPLKERARGRWRSILPALGIDSAYLTGKHMACPLCREGRDRFRFDDKDGAGSWICSHCGAGDGVKLVMLRNGWEFKHAAREIEALIGSAPRETAKPQQKPEDIRAAKNRLWRSGEPVTLATAAGRYLHARTGLTAFPACLRAVGRLRYPDGGYYPALIAKVQAPDGSPATLHRIYLDKNGGKAPVEDPKRLMPGTIPKGSAIRLGEVAAALGVAEGIETALSASVLFGMPVWATINCELLKGWEPPAEARDVIVFADNDENFAGQAAAFTLAHRIRKADRAVRIELPPHVGRDWNDVLMAQRSVAA